MFAQEDIEQNLPGVNQRVYITPCVHRFRKRNGIRNGKQRWRCWGCSASWTKGEPRKMGPKYRAQIAKALLEPDSTIRKVSAQFGLTAYSKTVWRVNKLLKNRGLK